MRNTQDLSGYGIERDEEPLPIGTAWFVCPRCHDRWAMPDSTTPNCGTCLLRDVHIVPMEREESRRCHGCG